MADLIAITYGNEAEAEAARTKVLEMQTGYLISLEDAVVVVTSEDGKIKLNQMFNATAAGAASGSFWGLLIGIIFLAPILGVLIGAASGALAGKLSDFGITDDFMKGMAAALKRNGAALFLLAKKMTAHKVAAGLPEFGGTVLRSLLDATKEKELRDAHDAQLKSKLKAA